MTNLTILFLIKRIILIYDVYDEPDNIRKFHKKKTSVAGGLIFLLNFLIFFIIILFNPNYLDYFLIFNSKPHLFYFILVSLIFFIIGYIDDKKNLSANFKFLVSTFLIILILIFDKNILITTLNFSFTEKVIFLGSFDFIFTLFCFLAFINAFNLFDGINCQIGFFVLFILIFFFINNFSLMLLAFLFFPLIIFFILNNRGILFLGNAGSYFLSFVIAYFFIKSYNIMGTLYSDQIFLIMLFPGVDMIRLFFIRIMNKQNPFSSDTNHIHHKLLNKFDYKVTFFITSVMSVMPFVISIFTNSYIALLLFLTVYFFLINFLKLNKKFF